MGFAADSVERAEAYSRVVESRRQAISRFDAFVSSYLSSFAEWKCWFIGIIYPLPNPVLPVTTAKVHHVPGGDEISSLRVMENHGLSARYEIGACSTYCSGKS